MIQGYHIVLEKGKVQGEARGFKSRISWVVSVSRISRQPWFPPVSRLFPGATGRCLFLLAVAISPPGIRKSMAVRADLCSHMGEAHGELVTNTCSMAVTIIFHLLCSFPCTIFIRQRRHSMNRRDRNVACLGSLSAMRPRNNLG